MTGHGQGEGEGRLYHHGGYLCCPKGHGGSHCELPSRVILSERNTPVSESREFAKEIRFEKSPELVGGVGGRTGPCAGPNAED